MNSPLSHRDWSGPAAFAAVLLALATIGATPPGRKPAALPDSVLARTGNREITVREFRNAWSGVQPPTRPDSLTPQSAREFLDLLVDKEILGAYALKEALPWSQRESLSFQGFRDQIVLKTRLDSLLAQESRARAAAGAPGANNPQVLGIAVRETTMLRIHVRFDDLVASRLALKWAAIPKPSPDSSMMAQIRMMGTMPKIEPSDTNKVVAWSDAGNVRTADLLESWKMTDPFRRPRVEKSEQIRDLAKNVLFERWLRHSAAEMQIASQPEIVRQIEKRREFQAVNRVIGRDVENKLNPDEATLHAWYDKHVDEYRIPDIADLIQLTLPDRASASAMFALLRDPVKAETLAAQGRRAGAEYHVQVTPLRDSVTYRAAERLGAGAVLGPDSTSQGWRVARVVRVTPSRRRSYEEAKELVDHSWRMTEGERLMRELLARLRRQNPVTANSRAIASLAAH